MNEETWKEEKDAERMILVFMKDPVQMEALCRTIINIGYRVMAINGSDLAIRILNGIENMTIDLLIADLTLPLVTGFEILKEARIVKPKLPLIAIVGSETTLKAARLLELGAIVIKRPYDPVMLSRLITHLTKEYLDHEEDAVRV